MHLKIYSIYDAAVEAFMPPFTAQTHGAAIRSFTDAVMDEGTNLNKHPEHFSLFSVGLFDQDSGMITADTAPTHLANALEYVNPQQEIE